MNVAETVLKDEMEIASVGRLMALVRQLQTLVSDGHLKQISGGVSIHDVNPQMVPMVVRMQFESVPGGSLYHLVYHDCGYFYRGSIEDFKSKCWDSVFSKRAL